MADVFISYAREDEAKVEAIERALYAHGISFWRDRSLKPGERFAQAIRREISNASAVLVCWTANSIDSKWVDDEAAEADRQNKYVGCALSVVSTLPMPFGRRNIVDLSQWYGEANDLRFLRVLEPIGALMGNRKISELAEARVLSDADRVAEAKAAAEAKQAKAEWEKQQAVIAANKQAAIVREATRQEDERQKTADEKTAAFIRRYYWWTPALVLFLACLLLPGSHDFWDADVLPPFPLNVLFMIPMWYAFAGLVTWIVVGDDTNSLPRLQIALTIILGMLPVSLMADMGPASAIPATSGALVLGLATAWWRSRDS